MLRLECLGDLHLELEEEFRKEAEMPTNISSPAFPRPRGAGHPSLSEGRICRRGARGPGGWEGTLGAPHERQPSSRPGSVVWPVPWSGSQLKEPNGKDRRERVKETTFPARGD